MLEFLLALDSNRVFWMLMYVAVVIFAIMNGRKR